MKTKKKTAELLFWSSIGCLLLHSCSFVVMPFARDRMLNGDDGNLFLLSGLLFWIPLILGYFLFFFGNRIRRRDSLIKVAKRDYGFFCPFSTLPGKLADAVFLLSVIVTGVLLAKGLTSYAVYILLAVTVFSFHAHGMLNGVNYIYIANRRKQQGGTEQ